MNMQQYIKSIRTTSNVGLWTSLGIALITIIVIQVSKYEFHPDPRTYRFFLIAGSALAIGAALLMFLSVRRSLPRLRQLDNIEERFRRYAEHVRYMYLGTMGCVILECAFVVLSNNRQLIMFLIVLVLMLFMVFPNIYRIKVDLGLTDEQMKEIFGTDYIPDPQEETDSDEPSDEPLKDNKE